MKPTRTIAIGDVHGCYDALSGLLKLIDPHPTDLLVFVGDYIDRGPDSKRVIQKILNLKKKFRVETILGNHEDMLLKARSAPSSARGDGRSSDEAIWMANGGVQTLESYNLTNFRKIPKSHWDFMSNCKLLFETDTHFFTHGSYEPNKPLDQQNPEFLLWERDNPAPHQSGKVAVLGHTPRWIVDFPHLKRIDTGMGHRNGELTALYLEANHFWTVNEQGKPIHRLKQVDVIRNLIDSPEYSDYATRTVNSILSELTEFAPKSFVFPPAELSSHDDGGAKLLWQSDLHPMTLSIGSTKRELSYLFWEENGKPKTKVAPNGRLVLKHLRKLVNPQLKTVS